MGMETVGLLMVCTAVVLACRVLRVPATLPLLVVALALLQVGALQAAAIPGLAQLGAMKTDLDASSSPAASASALFAPFIR